MPVIKLRQRGYQLEDHAMDGYAMSYRAYLARRDLPGPAPIFADFVEIRMLQDRIEELAVPTARSLKGPPVESTSLTSDVSSRISGRELVQVRLVKRLARSFIQVPLWLAGGSTPARGMRGIVGDFKGRDSAVDGGTIPVLFSTRRVVDRTQERRARRRRT
jgi:hypothetical protein